MRDELTQRQEKFVRCLIDGMSQRQAYISAYPSAAKWSDNAVDCRASKLMADAKIKQRYEELKREAAQHAVITRAEIIDGMAMKYRKTRDEVMQADRMGRHTNALNHMDSSADRLMQWLPEEREDGGAVNRYDLACLIAPKFLESHRAIKNGDATDIWLGGGRGSMKSSDASLEVVDWLMNNPQDHAAVFMKYKNALRDGAYAQVVWAINAMGLADEFDMPDSTLRITRKSTGQLILFRGVDNAKKIKSIKVPFGHIGIAWFEEADMFRGMGEIREVQQSVTRGGSSAVRIFSFNPPRSRRSWVNEHVEGGLADDARYYSSTYLEAPSEWLGPQFIADAEHLRDTDEQAYRHEYLGEPVGSGTEVFDRLEFREITDEEIARFDNPRIGQDFGWYPDPWAFTVSEWHAGSRTLLTYAEEGGNKLQPNEQAARISKLLDALKLGAEPVYSDDADPQSIDAQRAEGVNARKADKGRGREASYKWLQSVRWVIDPQRCPHLAAEVRAMEYEVNRDGEVLNRIPDGNDHWVDATRYAIMGIAKRGRTAYL